MAALFARLSALNNRQVYFLAIGSGLVLLLLLAALLATPLPLVLPAGLALIALAIYDLRSMMLLCVAAVPFSVEFYAGSISSDLPVEPLLILTTGLGLVFLLRNMSRIPAEALRHPISMLLAAHLAWIVITAFFSELPLHSWKYFAAKLWYVIPWYVLGGLLLSDSRSIKKFALFLAIPLAIVLIWCIARHAAYGFSFDMVNKAMSPFFRNHVNYAALPSITLPFVFLGAWLFPKGSWNRWGLWLVAFIMLFAVQTSYTRAAYVSIVAGIAFLAIMRFRLTKPAILLSLAIAVLGVSYFLSNNNFLRFAPDYNKTITHTDFNSLLEATYKLEDISTMERVYRWVAGGYMSAEHPWLGFGPGNFATLYQGYAIETFRTYVSDNPEGSGVHSYYIMTLVEQGWIGLFIFIALACSGLVTAERCYHAAINRKQRLLIMMAGASLVINLSFQLINDMIETDKAGPWFFFALAILVATDYRQRRGPQGADRTIVTHAAP